jgi:opacity protein-like surface antigen
MKKFLLASVLALSAVPAFAQYYNNCQVVMVDRYNRVISRFYAQRDYRSGMCREGLRQCNSEMRRRGIYGARCAQVNSGRGW